MWGGKSFAQWFRTLNPTKTHPVKPPLTQRERALNLALTQIGTKESPAGSNRQKYGVWYGLNGEPWCAIFVSYCFANSGYVGFKYAYVPAVAEAARLGENNLMLTSEPIPGDLALYQTAEGPNMHIAFFDGWINKVAGTFYDCGGNTAQGIDVNANGGEVYRQIRRRSTVTHFVRVG